MQMVLVYADPKDNRKRKRQLNAIIKRAGEIQDRCVQLMDIDLAGWKESVDVLPHGFRRENIVRAIMQALEKSTDRLPFAKVVEKSGYRKDAVRSSLRYLISVGKVIHHGKRGGYSPNRTRP
jgi:response regulator of citrate/malate metabolism